MQRTHMCVQLLEILFKFHYISQVGVAMLDQCLDCNSTLTLSSDQLVYTLDFQS